MNEMVTEGANRLIAKMLRLSLLLIIACKMTFVSAEAIAISEIRECAISEYERLEALNDQNELSGNACLNEYLIHIDTENWIEERPKKEILEDNFDRLSEALRNFNSKREDKLRFYVVVVNGYLVSLKQEVNLSDLPKEIRDYKLNWIVQRGEKSPDFERFRKELSSIPNEISEAMEKEGYDERAIYFFGKMKIDPYAKKGQDPDELYYTEYLFENLDLVGGRLKEKGPVIRSRVKADADPEYKDNAPERIGKAVSNVITAIEMVIDKGLGADDRDLRCTDITSLDQAIVETDLMRTYNLEDEISDFVNLFKNPEDKNKWGSHYVLGDNWDHFKNLGTFFREILPDKVNVLNDGFSDYQLHVVYKQIDFAMAAEEWKDFSRKVYERLGLLSKSLLITVPYYKISCTYGTGFGGDRTDTDLLIMPGAWCSTAGSDGLLSTMNSAFSTLSQNTKDKYVLRRWKDVFYQAFSKIPKDYKVYNYFVSWDGTIYPHKEKMAVHPRVVGLTDLVKINLMIDQRLDQYIPLVKSHTILEEEFKEDKDPRVVDFYIRMMETYHRRIQHLRDGEPDFQPFKGETGLKQSEIDEALVLQFTQWFVARKMPGVSGAAPDDDKFYGGENKVHTDDIIATIDNISLILSFIQLDFIADGIGLCYVLSKGRYEEATVYGAALALPVSAGALKAAAYGKRYILKTLDGKYIALNATLARAILRGGKFYGKVSDVTKALVHNPDALQNVIKHADDADFMRALETDLLKADRKTITSLNSHPDLIDDYYIFQKDKGDLEAFMKSRKVSDETKALFDNPEAAAYLEKFNDKNATLYKSFEGDLLKADEEIIGMINAEPKFIPEIHSYYLDGKGKLNDYFRKDPDDIMIIGEDLDVIASGHRLTPREDAATVVVHGKDVSGTKFASRSAYKNQETVIEPEELVERMRKKGYKEGTPVVLFSCHSGASYMLDGAAQRVADLLNVMVEAPTCRVGVLGDGRVRGGKLSCLWMIFEKGKTPREGPPILYDAELADGISPCR